MISSSVTIGSDFSKSDSLYERAEVIEKVSKDEDLLKPSAIADAFWYLAYQDPSAWTHELDVRPFKEKF